MAAPSAPSRHLACSKASNFDALQSGTHDQLFNRDGCVLVCNSSMLHLGPMHTAINGDSSVCFCTLLVA